MSAATDREAAMRPILCPVCGCLLSMEGECRYCDGADEAEWQGPDRLKTALWVLMILALAIFIGMSIAARAAGMVPCRQVSEVEEAAKRGGLSWRVVGHDEWNFLRGFYVRDPKTPPGLPPGDRAAIANFGNDFLIYFLDGDEACGPMIGQGNIVEILKEVAAGKTGHEGDPL